ncbi:hypothetical protein EV702DRAFT_1043220 [Suillus placidus]|uniref:Uncharacterized protein n=1 Tax=Suillus placidus TaxID=48579 RepID=A0A9P7A0V3_9AGAM|nr:hypothetical protein EV702DRAFT_1043220 [Suillus placidus]
MDHVMLRLCGDFPDSDCSDFQAEWNCHLIWGPDMNDKSPKALRFLGQTLFGMYHDDCEGVHPDQWQHIHYEAVGVPSHRNAFGTDKEMEGQFFAVLAEVFAKQITPAHSYTSSFPDATCLTCPTSNSIIWTGKTSAGQLIPKVNFVTVKIFILDMGMKDTVPSVGMDTSDVPDVSSPPGLLSSPKPTPSSSSTAAVKEIFNHVTAKRGSSIKAAREEALSTLASTRLVNYSKLSKGPGPSANSQKTQRDTTTSSSQPTGSQARQSTTTSVTSTFCVASVGILICGVDRYGTIRVSKVPLKNGMNEIQAMKNRGCYVDEQAMFYHDWSYSRISQLLRKLFPKVFNYLDAERPRNVSLSQSAAGQDKKLLWRLLNKSGQLVQIPKATVMVQEMEFLSDTDSIGDANYNPELASSLMEMELSDSGDIHTNYKGKETAAAIPCFLPLQSSPSLSQLSIPSVPAASVTCPELSHPPMIVSPQPNNPFALAAANLWESKYVIRPIDYLI